MQTHRVTERPTLGDYELFSTFYFLLSTFFVFMPFCSLCPMHHNHTVCAGAVVVVVIAVVVVVGIIVVGSRLAFPST